ncbi:tectonin beta-propeller repeat-containing protein 1 [Eurytemora carolleeae]|uniref:tectonin beta-propeller repeat-containing protein 1 n=1 Tax=Eurytemora carolleeae TaxID=1294199 RepID=UPI000C7828DB|nr:tectonin beta-propeller repeat-containing protein 1 [Eurytemora carolleeae]|eukprot:XP_023339608.1 tectonin beta-propeller repeat-containing protein 1-like [Eurytemora affinis]
MRASVKKPAGSGVNISSLTLFSEQEWRGESYTTEESQTQLKKFCKFSVKSIIVKGNPWVLYGEPGNIGRPFLVEEGKYSSLESFPQNIESVKLIVENLESPILMVHASAKLKGSGSESGYRMMEGRTMRSVASGTAGVWAVAKDNTVWVRTGCAGKTSSSVGESWTKCQGSPIKLVSVGYNTVWCIDLDGHIVVRTEVTASSPAGKAWANVDGDMKSIAASSKGHVWAVDKSDRVWWRKGAKIDSPTGSTWKHISGNLAKISVGSFGVWGLDSKNEVYFRDGTAGDADETEGSSWTMVEGKFIDICVGSTSVW